MDAIRARRKDIWLEPVMHAIQNFLIHQKEDAIVEITVEDTTRDGERRYAVFLRACERCK